MVKRSIFTKLIGSFVFYALCLIATFVLCLVLQSLIIGEGDIPSIEPQHLMDENGAIQNINIAENMGGWIEELDNSYHVQKVYGTKRTDAQGYTTEELLKYTSPYGKTKYLGIFMKSERADKTYICFYDRAVMQINPTVIVNGVSEYGTLNAFIFFIPLSILEIVLISLYLKSKIKRPLKEIMKGMERLKYGEKDARILVETEAEFEQIIETFNMMAEQLEMQKAEKERMIQQKNQMLLELSHDIKTPIATIKSYASALQEGLVPEEKLQNYYHTIEQKANRVHTLSEDMFIMLKMDNPNYTLQCEQVNMCEFMRQQCAEYYDEITQNGFDFEIDIPDSSIEVSIDTNLCARVVANLLSNAQKYNMTGNRIAVKVETEQEKQTFMVCDDGEAIDEAFVQEMFQAFSRADKSRKTSGGTGLGLAISKLIVEKHGGKIFYSRVAGWNIFEVQLLGNCKTHKN